MMNVHVLVSCRSPEMQRTSTLVFDTIRTGFPNCEIHVWDNHNTIINVKEITKHLDVKHHHIQELGTIFMMKHWDWIRNLVDEERGNFCIVDTDVIFFDSVEKHLMDANLIGEYIPTFYDQLTKLWHIERLHTAVMMINSTELKRIEGNANKDRPPTVAPFDLINPRAIMFRGSGQYYDTMANAYHSMNGFKNFPKDRQGILREFVHLHCGSWMDYVERLSPSIHENLRKKQARVIEDPEKNYVDFRKELIKFYETQGAYNYS